MARKDVLDPNSRLIISRCVLEPALVPWETMSLVVFAYLRDAETGESRPVQEKPARPHTDLAGIDSTRHALWGSDLMRALGCELLPRLAEGDLRVEGRELDALEGELRLVLRELSRLSIACELRTDYIEQRTRNILEAIRLARAAGPEAGVAIE